MQFCITFCQFLSFNHMVRHPRCFFINYNWINQLSNTTIWWLEICRLLHKYQPHVSALMVIFWLIDWQQTCKQLYIGMRLVYGGGGLGLDGVRDLVCVEEGGYYIDINYMFRLLWPSSGWYIDNKLVSSCTLACVLCMVEGRWGWMGVRDLVCVE